MIVDFDFKSSDSYRMFKEVRRLPQYTVKGRSIDVPDVYAKCLGMRAVHAETSEWFTSPFLFEHQAAIAHTAIEKQKYAVFAGCGTGKTLILLEFALFCRSIGKRTLIVSPLMVCNQTVDECEKFYGFRPQVVPAAKLQEWLDGEGDQIAVTNYEAIREGLRPGKLGALIVDESSLLKSHYGKYGTRLIQMGKGLDYKLALTGTPAPNDRVEYANHAVFLDQSRTVNEFLARYFVNRGQTSGRWELKQHAIRPFYRDMASWSIFVDDPTVYGWESIGEIPPIEVKIERIPMTDDQIMAVRDLTGNLMTVSAGGIGQRSKLSQIAKGQYKGKQIATNKFSHIRELVDSWPDESTILWCRFNLEQEQLGETFPGCANISGNTPIPKRIELIDGFKSGEIPQLLSKPKILGFGLNLQVATRQVFSSCDDSYEEFVQAIKRSNRIGSTKKLGVHIAITEIEEPMVQNVLEKAHRVEEDTKEQERLYLENRIA